MRHSILFIILIIICQSLVNAQEEEPTNAISEFVPGLGMVNDICFSRDSCRLAISNGKQVDVYDFKTKQLIYSLEGGHKSDILSMDIAPDDSYLVSGDLDGTIVTWDLKTHQLKQKYNYHKGVISCVKFSPNQREIASSSSDKTVVLYDTEANKILFQFDFHQKNVNSIAFNSTGEILASGGDDKLVFLTNTRTGKSIARLSENKGIVRTVKFSNDDSRLIACDDNSNLIVWKTDNLSNIKVVKNDKLYGGWLLSTDIYNDGKIFVTGSVKGKVSVVSFFGNNTFNVKFPVLKVLFIPDKGAIIKLVVATRGKGVLLVDTSK
jgi:WD40 repeat protein